MRYLFELSNAENSSYVNTQAMSIKRSATNVRPPRIGGAELGLFEDSPGHYCPIIDHWCVMGGSD